MATQIDTLVEEYRAVQDRLARLVSNLDEVGWRRSPSSGGWSIGECITHLNLTSRDYLPLIDALFERAERDRIVGEGPFRRDPIGWFLCRTMEPPARGRFKTASSFEPRGVAPMADATEEFNRLQDSLIERLRHAGDRKIALNRLKLASPFNEHVKYSLWSAFRLVPAHQRRHLWQAEGVKGGTQN
jgi:hypothetical protein